MNLSKTLKRVNFEESKNIFYALKDSKLPLSELIENTEYNRLDLIPSSEYLRIADVDFYKKYNSTNLLKKAITESIKEDYDFILIDTPPSLNILTVNGLAAAIM